MIKTKNNIMNKMKMKNKRNLNKTKIKILKNLKKYK